MVGTWRPRLGALLGALALLTAFAPAAFAAQGAGGEGAEGSGGQSTPGVIVTANNPGTSAAGSDMHLTLTAHTEKSATASPDCRPAEGGRPGPTLRCWGTLVLSVPSEDGLTVTGFQEVHKVAIGETSCGDEESGGCGDEAAAAASGPGAYDEDQAQVNGIAVVTDPGDTPMDAGMSVQVHITLYDNGAGQYQDEALVQVRPKGPDQNSIPWAYESEQPIQQVQIHFLGG